MKLGKPSSKTLIRIAAPLLVVIAIFGFYQRKGNDRVQALPALLIGIGFICTGFVERHQRRKKLFLKLNQMEETNNS
ncbi:MULTISPECIES: DUF3188 domain-containing protein [Prochlorococcus]|uniref:DUF3188 domain-containing protein n=1 Tax=Prochlorococcus TaxID=1218 RepID=UPI000533B41A|nr:MULTISPECIES: DUF3188 domain-containing protein [Prochlorococcus]KGG13641.1 hypothetical protein EV05_0298 [Prochlorococcus sp. MIT 0601]